MKPSNMQAQMKQHGRGVPKSVGRAMGVLPVDSASTGSRRPAPPTGSLPPRQPAATYTASARKAPSSSRASSGMSYSSLASGRSTRDRPQRAVSDQQQQQPADSEGQDIHFIDGPGNTTVASSRSLRRQKSTASTTSATTTFESRTLTPDEILATCEEDAHHKVFEVDLNGVDITVVPDLEKFRTLKVLDLSSNRIQKIENLDFNKDLRDLKLFDNALTKVEGLEKLCDLRNLQLQHNQIDRLGKGLSSQKKLLFLRLDNNRLDTLDSSELLSCVQLSFLDISSNNLTSLAAVSYLPNLVELYASANCLQKLTSLSRCKKLTEVDLSRNELTDLSPLAGLHQLQMLDVSHNKIKSLHSLGKLRSVNDIRASHNMIRELSGLYPLFPGLQVLMVDNNSIPTWQQICNLKELTLLVELSIAENPATVDGGEGTNYHSSILTVLPNLEHLDGHNLKRPEARGSAAPVMRPMSASSVVSIRQIDAQLQNATQEQENLTKAIMDRFNTMKNVLASLPKTAPATAKQGAREEDPALATQAASYMLPPVSAPESPSRGSASSASSARSAQDPLPPLSSLSRPSSNTSETSGFMLSRRSRKNVLRDAKALAATFGNDQEGVRKKKDEQAKSKKGEEAAKKGADA